MPDYFDPLESILKNPRDFAEPPNFGMAPSPPLKRQSQAAAPKVKDNGQDPPADAIPRVFVPDLEDVFDILFSDGHLPVLLHINAREKGPQWKGWSEKTYADTQSADYQEELRTMPNTGVLLGAPSGDLCTIDLDTDAAMEAFLGLNLVYKEALTTRGERGAQIWVYVRGERPRKVYKLRVHKDSPLAVGAKEKPDKHDMVEIGEWRAEGGQSVIRGIHPCGCRYTWLVAKPPIMISFDEIRWPNDIAIPWQEKTQRKREIPAAASNDGLLRRAIEALRIDWLWTRGGLPPRGRSNPVCSPFREEKHPSFSIYDEGRRFKDFGFDEHRGDSFDFYQLLKGKSASDAFVEFVELAGLGHELKSRQSQSSQHSNGRSDSVLERAQDEKAAAELQRFQAFLEATIKGAKLLEIQIPAREIIINDWLKEGDLGFIFAYRGSGKTWLAVALMSALAEGTMCGPWVVHEGKSWPVLYVDGEMPADDIRQRIKAINGGQIPEKFHLFNHEILYSQSELVINLAALTDQRLISKICSEKQIKVLVLDNLGCLFTGVGENDADEWEKVLPWLLELRRAKVTVIIIHHTGVNTSRMRGTSKREDAAAWVLRLDDKKEGTDQPGAKFITRFSKCRGSKVILDYEWVFTPFGNVIELHWAEASRIDVVLQWVRDGLETCTEIANEMGLSPGQVSKLAARLIEEDKLRKNKRRYEVVEP